MQNEVSEHKIKPFFFFSANQPKWLIFIFVILVFSFHLNRRDLLPPLAFC